MPSFHLCGYAFSNFEFGYREAKANLQALANLISNDQWTADGKFFRSGLVRVQMNAVTYGPFPGGWPESFEPDFSQMIAAGFNAVRLYELPDVRLLDAAANHGLKIFGGLKWRQSADFFQSPVAYTAAIISLTESLRQIGTHPSLVGIYVGNEIPADIVRWMGPLKVREAIEGLIAIGKELAPHLLFAYANYPSTEYLEPENADFTAFNVYLENEDSFRSYLKRLHHIAGDRPLVISEFGLDTRRNGMQRQAECLVWATQASLELECAGMTLYAWSDRWQNAGIEVLDWDFGLLDRSGKPKPALTALSTRTAHAHNSQELSFSIIICTRNGGQRIGNCLRSIKNVTGNLIETIVVVDGSSDDTADFVAKKFPWVRLECIGPSGLSAARNAGARIAQGEILAFTDDDCEVDHEWITRLQRIFQEGRFAAVGGPNLSPKPKNWQEAVVCAAPGAPSHVMLDDEQAEHLPGCNLAVTRSAFDTIGGFDPQFCTAGDDVDFCWRLQDAGLLLGFAPGAYVWHWRRQTLVKFLIQQLGYGRAEHLLLAKHPARFTSQGDARWIGFIYGGGPVRVMAESVIDHGAMGNAGYQAITNRVLPLRGLEKKFDTWKARIFLNAIKFIQPHLRAWTRNRTLLIKSERARRTIKTESVEEFAIESPEGYGREYFINLLLQQNWKPAGNTEDWDLEKSGIRLLLATERGDCRTKRTLIRAWNTKNLSALMSEFR